MVEQEAVNFEVVGSSPTGGAKKLDTNSFAQPRYWWGWASLREGFGFLF